MHNTYIGSYIIYIVKYAPQVQFTLLDIYDFIRG